MEQSFEQGTLPVSHRQRVFSLGIDRIQNVRDLAGFPVVDVFERVEPVLERVENLGPLPIGYAGDFVVNKKKTTIGQFNFLGKSYVQSVRGRAARRAELASLARVRKLPLLFKFRRCGFRRSRPPIPIGSSSRKVLSFARRVCVERCSAS
jgi:hypothetical protein